jgi:ornithine cyclodeaminase/alanine dehydrogenase
LIISVDKHEGFVYYMPAYLSQTESLAIKIVTQYEENLKHGLPTILASILLNDPENGKPLALMDGTYITATRTGAASAVATKYLARKDSSVAGVIGTGGQARAQVQGLREVLENLARVKVYDILPKRAEEFAHSVSRELSLTAEAVGTSKLCVENSDVMVLATTSRVPVLDGDWIGEGAHINSIGVVGPEGRELDDKTVKKAKIVVDTVEGALAETGDLIIPIKKGIISRNDIYAELHEIVGGKKLGRTSNYEITCWKAVGMALEDAAVAKLVYNKAKKEGIGKEVEI